MTVPVHAQLFTKVCEFSEMKLVPMSDIIFLCNLYIVKTALQHVMRLSTHYFSDCLITGNLFPGVICNTNEVSIINIECLF